MIGIVICSLLFSLVYCASGEILNVHIVPHTHDDVGWLKTVDEYYYGGKNKDCTKVSGILQVDHSGLLCSFLRA